jgi:16S rRNA (guanine966-N2)-methyltransferase
MHPIVVVSGGRVAGRLYARAAARHACVDWGADLAAGIFMRVRIIGGQWRGRRISAPACEQTRPYPDRVRQAVFDALGSHFDRPGSIPPIAVLDLYAGSGAMGLEALSRGAAFCTFVERDARAADQLRQTIDQIGATGRARVVTGDVERVPLDAERGDPIRLAFIDPPYAVSAAAGRRGSVPELMRHLAGQPGVAADALFLLRHPVDVRYDEAMLPGYRVRTARSFGGMSVTWLEIADPSVASAGGAA